MTPELRELARSFARVANTNIGKIAQAALDAERDLHELRMRVEEADALATKKPSDDGEWVAGYHFNTGAWHRLLAEARKGDAAAPDGDEGKGGSA